jgi:L-rhamnose mutarotase
MQRFCFYVRLFPGTEEEYDRRHRAIWPRLAEAIRRSGIRNMSGFRRGTDVWYYAECEPDAGTAFARLRSESANGDWNREFRTIIAEMSTPDGELIRFDEVFHTNGGRGGTGAGSSSEDSGSSGGSGERGVFVLVVDPDRVAEYDARHAAVWPEMLEALDVSGFHNYTGFRRGRQVVYYGEFEPDMTTALARMGETDVNRRWGDSFEGIITTLTDELGHVIGAREVFHQD